MDRCFPGLILMVLACGPTGTETVFQVVAGDGQVGLIGQELPDPLVGRVVDEYGTPRPGRTVRFEVTSGGGSMFLGASTSDGQGLVRDRWTLGTSPGEAQRVEVRSLDPATGAALILGEFTASIAAGIPASLSSEVIPSSGEAGATVEVTYRVRDHYGDGVAGVAVQWESTVDDGGPALTSTISDADGIARVSWTLPTTAGPMLGRARMGAELKEFTIQVNPGPAVGFEDQNDPIGGAPGTLTVRAVQVHVVDAFGNRTDSDAVRLRVVEGGGHLNLPGSPTEATVATMSSGLHGASMHRGYFGPSYWVLGPAVGRNVLSVSLPSGAEVIFTTDATAPYVKHQYADGASIRNALRVHDGREYLTVWAHICQEDPTLPRLAQVGDRVVPFPPVSGDLLNAGMPFGCLRNTDVEITGLPTPLTVTVSAEDVGGSASHSIVVVRD